MGPKADKINSNSSKFASYSGLQVALGCEKEILETRDYEVELDK